MDNDVTSTLPECLSLDQTNSRIGGRLIVAIITLITTTISHNLHADQLSVIGSNVMQGSGRAAINLTSGSRNLQTNSHAIGHNASIHSVQRNIPSEHTLSLNEIINATEEHLSKIDNVAFAQFQGLISVNQASGRDNMQSNLGGIALNSITGLGLSDDALTQVSTQAAPSFSTSQYRTDIALDSFQDSQGVVQINQISGNSNIAVNQFSLQLPSGNN